MIQEPEVDGDGQMNYEEFALSSRTASTRRRVQPPTPEDPVVVAKWFSQERWRRRRLFQRVHERVFELAKTFVWLPFSLDTISSGAFVWAKPGPGTILPKVITVLTRCSSIVFELI